ncbi:MULTISPECIES: response regulator [Sphingobacterium]|uniref:response regulator n=1 Tax=Sphingobacterium TaxID=28453 RepID=UPI0028A2D6A1|nr:MULTISPECIES: response regulator [Sphingobacterium]
MMEKSELSAEKEKIFEIILIDDDSIFCFLVSKMIQSFTNMKIDLKIFSDGIIALNHLNALHIKGVAFPNVLLVDINMPLMNGWQFLEELESMKISAGIDVPRVLIVSSSVSQEDLARANKIPYIERYLTKPFTAEQLFQALNVSN